MCVGEREKRELVCDFCLKLGTIDFGGDRCVLVCEFVVCNFEKFRKFYVSACRGSHGKGKIL